MSEEGWWSGDLYLRRYVRDLEMVVSADDLTCPGDDLVE